MRMASISVLVADGQYLFADVLARALDYQPELEVCHERPDCADDTIAVAEHRRPDVTLVDYRLDTLPGPAVVEELLARVPTTNVLTLSWIHGSTDMEKVLDAGAVGFLPKTLRFAYVLEAIHRAQHGECPVFEHDLDALRQTLEDRQRSVEAKMRRFGTLTPRELAILEKLGAGLSVRAVAAELSSPEHTVRTHIRNMKAKIGARTQLELVTLAQGRAASGPGHSS